MQQYLLAFAILPVLAAQPVDLVLYAATDAGVQVSRDDGRTWRKISEGLNETRIAQLVPGRRNDSRVVYAATSSGVFQTTDGETWVRILEELRVTSLSVDPADEQRVYAAAAGKLWTTDNGGRSWNVVTSPFPVGVVTVDPYSSQRLYLSATHNYDRPFATSTDRGTSWRTFESLPAVPFLTADPSTPGRLYASTVTLVQSGDYGQTWIQMGPNPRDLFGVLPDGAHFADLRQIAAVTPDRARPSDVHACIEARWTRYEDPEDFSSPYVTGLIPGWASLVSGLWIAGTIPGDQPCTAVVRLEDQEATLYASGTKVFRRNGLLSRRVDPVADLGSPVRSLIAVRATQ